MHVLANSLLEEKEKEKKTSGSNTIYRHTQDMAIGNHVRDIFTMENST